MKYQRFSIILTLLIMGSLRVDLGFSTKIKNNSLSLITQSKDMTRIQIIVTYLANRIVEESQSTHDNFLITYAGLTNKSRFTLQTVMNELLKSIEDVPIHNGQIDEINFHYICHVHLYLVDSLEAFIQLTKEIPLQDSREYQYLIVLVPPEIQMIDPFDTMEEIFKILLDIYIINANIVVLINDEEIHTHTYFPYTGSGDCRSTRPQLIDLYKCKEPIKPMRMLYPSKLENLNGCPLILATTHAPPYIMLDAQSEGLQALSGTDGVLMKQIALKLNFTIDIMDTGEIGGFILRNGTAKGVYKILHERRANITLGDTSCSSRRLSLLSGSTPYYQSNIRVIGKRGKTYSAFEILFYPISKSFWCIWFGLCLIRFIILKFRHIKHLFPFSFRRFLFAMWLIIMLYYRIGYESFYFIFMRNRPLKPLPNTIEEFHQQGYTVIADRISNNFLNYYNSNMLDMLLRCDIEPEDTFEMLENLSSYKYGALTKNKYLAYYLHRYPEKRHMFYMSKEKVVSDIMCIYFPRSSYFVAPFDSILLRLRDFGIIEKYANEFINFDALKNIMDPYRKSPPYIESLGINHFVGAFLLLFLWWLLAFVVFILERLSPKVWLLKKFIDTLH